MNYPLAIVQVKSRTTGREYFAGIPSADVDYVTDGMLILTSKEKNELLLCMATTEEYPLGPDEACRRCVTRMQNKLERDDLAPVIMSLKEPARRLAWLAGLFTSWKFAFVDIYNQNSFADPVSEFSCEDFLSYGGVIRDLTSEQ